MHTAVVAQFEIAARNPDVLRRFYALLFGWRFSAVDHEPRVLSVMTAESNGVAAVITSAADGTFGGVRLTVEVNDVFENLCYAEELGGRIIDPPHEVASSGRRLTVASFIDPEGNCVGLSSRSQTPTSASELAAG